MARPSQGHAFFGGLTNAVGQLNMEYARGSKELWQRVGCCRDLYKKAASGDILCNMPVKGMKPLCDTLWNAWKGGDDICTRNGNQVVRQKEPSAVGANAVLVTRDIGNVVNNLKRLHDLDCGPSPKDYGTNRRGRAEGGGAERIRPMETIVWRKRCQKEGGTFKQFLFALAEAASCAADSCRGEWRGIVSNTLKAAEGGGGGGGGAQL